VRAEPSATADRLGKLNGGVQQRADALLFSDYSWLRIPWQGLSGHAWIAGEFTDFPRSRAYDQAVEAWYQSEAVLQYRRSLVHNLLRVTGADADDLAQVNHLAGDDLRKMENRLTRQTVPAGYVKLWQMREHIGLPAPFEFLPVHTSPPAGIKSLEFNGFGPNTFAYEHWPVYYERIRGLHNGVDYIVPEGSPLIAVADGVIVDFRFLANPMEWSLALRPYLPEPYRKPDGSRVLSNVIVAYGHLTGDPTSQLVRVGSSVKAGQIIGTSGWPVYTRDDGSVGIQHNNAHLHLEVHLITDGQRQFGSRQPFNPLLFWSPRLIALQARLAAHRYQPPYPTEGQPWGRLGFFSLGCFRYEPPTIVWQHQPKPDAIWPEGVYDLNGMIKLLGTFAPYPVDGSV
jgi:murein DD-endopeptidase MepM/ murein hydrolase activator NlpD